MALEHFETIVILSDKLTEEEYKEKATTYKNLIEEGADGSRIKDIDMMGKKKLAYPIKKYTEGWYILFTYKTRPKNIASLERYLRIDDTVLKFLTIKKDPETDELEEYAEVSEDEIAEATTEIKSEQDIDAWDVIFDYKEEVE